MLDACYSAALLSGLRVLIGIDVEERRIVPLQWEGWLSFGENWAPHVGFRPGQVRPRDKRQPSLVKTLDG